MPTRPTAKPVIRLYLAAPDCAARYRPGLLGAADRAHLLRYPARAAQTGWRVSRFLKQQAGASGRNPLCPLSGSLSHSGGHAVLAVPSAAFAVGADLERLRPRRFDAWPEWVLHKDERLWLQGHAEPSGHYALWTLKEALLKATGQTLADLPQVGLRRRREDDWQLCAGGQLWRGAAFLLDEEWVCGVVWQGKTVCLEWRGFGAWQAVSRRPLYAFPLSG